MKKILLLFVLALSTTFIYGQANKGLNFGVGFSNGGIPVYITYDIPVHADIAIAPMVTFDLDGMDGLTVGAKGDYYFDRLLTLPEAFDVYAGINLGFKIDLNNNKNNGGLRGGIEIGARWFWSEKWGLNLEFGGGIGYGGRFGLTYKM